MLHLYILCGGDMEQRSCFFFGNTDIPIFQSLNIHSIASGGYHSVRSLTVLVFTQKKQKQKTKNPRPEHLWIYIVALRIYTDIINYIKAI